MFFECIWQLNNGGYIYIYNLKAILLSNNDEVVIFWLALDFLALLKNVPHQNSSYFFSSYLSLTKGSKFSQDSIHSWTSKWCCGSGNNWEPLFHFSLSGGPRYDNACCVWCGTYFQRTTKEAESYKKKIKNIFLLTEWDMNLAFSDWLLSYVC